MHEWLKLFVLMHRKYTANKASEYLASKDLTVELWADKIWDGRKGDMLILFTLNLLMEMHTIVHLKDGQTWTTLANPNPNHSDDIKCCEIHLVYVGRGLFIELIEHENPLEIVENTEETTSIIISELTSTEERAIDEVVKLGLGVGIMRESKGLKPIPSASAGSACDLEQVEKELIDVHKNDNQLTPPKTIAMEEAPMALTPTITDSTQKTVLKICLNKLKMEPNSSIVISRDIAIQMPCLEIPTSWVLFKS